MNEHERFAAKDSSLLPAIRIETAPLPQWSVIWLHGLGADGHDFEPIVDEMSLDSLPAIRFIFPHAPMRPVTINGGFVMRAWYDIVTPDFSQRREDQKGVRESAVQIEALIARENELGVSDEHIVLAGFSQGGAIALHAGLRHARRLAGIIALSTYLPSADTLPDEAATANRDVPIFMAHGHGDTVIPYAMGQRSSELLKAQGYPLAWHPYFAEHTVCMEELRDIETWLRRIMVQAS
ncbi:alpha/beta hydrolase [Propionivibrio sp.]|uniref:alpha/beta hydrolase n=1 Tax=Propionivibrio sp. TaxID=2212460 RepID=UPI0025E954E3|nr:alpha/beta hydrolase [Propionivibrio sp.]MBK7355456.1 dienelactone hydrolase family protein [Propionivibrio sp.]MBK8400878.1 dienelactone hydrolase family protein [Propionivibrio sp.]MBK8744456.1 dienelactone hydrolase family protein [Propionivibrio sp.]MBK8895040.1 dienelactone hydrolase family protein [Propionivibrio sp.]MBL0209146.1 dienelactone hydrolase family protein [Propionivibrio sp.]